MSRRQLGLPVQKVEAYQLISDDGPYILIIPVGPWGQLVKFLIDMGAQISILTQKDAEKLGMQSGWQRVKITSVNRATVVCWTYGSRGGNACCLLALQLQVIVKIFLVSMFLTAEPGACWRGSVWSHGSNTNPNLGRHWATTAQVLHTAPHSLMQWSLTYRNIRFLRQH